MDSEPEAGAPAADGAGSDDWSETEPRALLTSIVDASHDAIVSKTLDGIVTSWNAAAQRIFGYTAAEMVGHHIGKLIPEERQEEEDYILARIRRGESIDHFDTIRRHKDGTPISVSLTVSPVRSGDGKLIGVSKIARDISEHKRLQEAQRLLDREINHRSKNLLAVVDAIVRQTAAHGPKEEFTQRITQRLRALAANQDLLVESSWRGAEMRELVASQLVQVEDLPDARVGLSGEALTITPMAAQALGMAIHELAVNAVTFGALSRPEGSVAVAWQLEQTPAGRDLLVSWQETGGPAVTRPERAGFGTTIIERITGQALGGEVAITYAPAGLRWEVRAPAAALVSVGPEAPLPDMDAGGR